MVRDIYTRSPKDPNYKFGVYEHSDPIESIVAQIKMILNTSPGQVYSNIAFGIGLEDLIFQTRINKIELEEKIKGQIYQYIEEAKDYSIRPQVSFGRDAGSDFAIVDIFINDTRTVGILVK